MRHGLAPETASELAGTLSRIASALERLDARLSTNGASHEAKKDAVDEVPAALPSGPPGPSGRANGSPGRLLEEGIREVLAEIARVKKETEQRLASLGDRAATEEEQKLRQTSFQALATLRRRQAELLYRLQSDSGPGGIDPLSTL